MKQLLFIAFVLSSITSSAQDTAILRKYLQEHRYTIDLKSDHPFYMLPELMKGKNLFVLGEGGSHDLDMYTKLKPAIIDQLVTQHLKYYFIESGRSVAYYENKYLDHQISGCLQLEKYIGLPEHKQDTIQKECNYKIIGIDFERPSYYYAVINFVFKDVDLEKAPHSKALFSKLTDTSNIIHAKTQKEYKKSVKEFQHFYKGLKHDLYEDSPNIKTELGDKYYVLEYLLTNPNRKYPWRDRNPPMARNLLKEIIPLDTSSAYFLSIGMAHSLPNERPSTVHKLCKNDLLKNKLLVMNTYCENCSVKGVPTKSRSPIKYLRKDVLACFSQAANSEFVVFDLSQLPDEFSYMKKSGEMLLYAKDQK